MPEWNFYRGLLSVIVLAGTNVIFRIFRTNFNAMPFFIVQCVRWIVADAVLIAEFCRDFIQDALNFASSVVGPVSRK